MKGNGEERGGAREDWSLGSGSCRTRRFDKDVVGVGIGGVGQSAEEMDGSSCSRMLALLSSNGLNMLAGLGNAGFSLKPPPSGMVVPSPASLSSKGAGYGTSGKVSGGAFTGFYRASPTTMRPQDGTLRFATSEETRTTEEGVGTPLSQRSHNSGSGKNVDYLGETDIPSLSREELWRLILKHGSQWPSWKRSVGPRTPVSHGKIKEHTVIPESAGQKDGKVRGSFEGLQTDQFGHDTLRKLALEELAARPLKQSGMASAGVLATKQTAQESYSISRTTAVEALPVAKKMTGYAFPALSQWPESLSALTPKTSDRASERTTASLTIFYAGTVNVCENVPEDKAQLIMLLAERAGNAYSAHKPVESGSVSALKVPTEATKALRQVPITLPTTPVEEQAEGSLAKISESDTLSGSANIQADSSPLVQGSSEKSSPTKVQGPAQGSNPNKRPLQGTPDRHQVTRPLPFCRKSSLARFLDSRNKRHKKQPAGTLSHLSGGSKATNDLKDGCEFTTPLCSQSSISMKGDSNGVSGMGEDSGAGIDMKNMNMENQALPMET